MSDFDKRFNEARNTKWEHYKEESPPKGQAKLYYKDNLEYWRDGFFETKPALKSAYEALTVITKEYDNGPPYTELDWLAWKQRADKALAEIEKLLGGESE